MSTLKKSLVTAIMCALIFTGCIGEDGGAIIAVKKAADNGQTARFAIYINFASLPAGEGFLSGQESPNGRWIAYPVTFSFGSSIGKVTIEWPKGEGFEFSFGIKTGGASNWFDPSGSKYFFNGHYKIVLGEKEVCQYANTGDSLITQIEDFGGTGANHLYQIFINVDSLMSANYQDIVLVGQSAPDGPWTDYAVVDCHPCYYVEFEWPKGKAFEFTYKIIKADGSVEFIDPSGSRYAYDGHFKIDL